MGLYGLLNIICGRDKRDEPTSILCKDSARQEKYKAKNAVFKIWTSEPQSILYKDRFLSANLSPVSEKNARRDLFVHSCIVKMPHPCAAGPGNPRSMACFAVGTGTRPGSAPTTWRGKREGPHEWLHTSPPPLSQTAPPAPPRR